MNKNKNIFAAILIVIAALFASPLKAQVTIGEQTPPQSFSVLELISANKGLRLPQLTAQQRNDLEASADFQNQKTDLARGLTIFNMDTKCVNVWNGEVWIEKCAQPAVPPLTTTAAITAINDDVPDCTGPLPNNGWTNDAAPTVKGTISAALGNGESVVIYRSDNGGAAVKLSGTATVTGTDWTYDDSGLQSGHTYAYTAKVVSSGGGESVFSNAWSIQVDTDRPTHVVNIVNYTDDQDPQTGVFNFSIPTNDQTPLISGTIDKPLAEGETLVLYRATGAATPVKVATLTVNGDLTWTYQETPPLPATAGTVYTYTARVEDAACNYGDYSAPAKLTLDTQAPPRPAIEEVIDNYIGDCHSPTGTIKQGTGYCNDPYPEIRGSGAQPNAKVFIYDNGNLIGTTVAQSNGNYGITQADYSNPLPDGLKVITASTADAAGNISNLSNAYRFTQDTTPSTNKAVIVDYWDAVPSYIGVRQSGETTNDPQPTLRGTIVDKDGQPTQLPADERVVLFSYPDGSMIGGTLVIDATRTSWEYKLNNPLPNHSTNNYWAKILDSAGNCGPYSDNIFTIIVELYGEP